MTAAGPTTTATPADRARQVTVTVAYLVCLLGSMIGVGVFGGQRIAEAAGGALSADATLLAPGGPAFSIWSVIYVGLAGYVVLQWLPRWAADPRQRAVGYLVALTMVLNAAWIFSVQGDLLWLSVVVILVLLAALCRVIVLLARTRAAHLAETVLLDGTLGLYLGWVCVATAANIAATLADAGFDGGPLAPEGWAVLVCAVVAVVGIGLAVRLGARIAPAAAIVWGLVWIAVARTTGQPESRATMVAAGTAAGVVVVATLLARVRREHAEA
ncbi:MAG: tryptophan-rich sensory protein [Actinomycetales bacterium]|nr:tryptophan-rich sensory protein [Actinomycetales bacterium]